jgi:hypothetical protein
MEEARAVLARLERIEALDRANAESSLVLAELRELVREVEAWTRRERAALVEDHVIVEV